MLSQPTPGLGTLIRHFLELTDGELESIYREEHPYYTPRFTPVMKALASSGPLTIREIAEQSGTSHSAASQTVSKMVDRKLVTLKLGEDRRSRVVALSKQGEKLIPWLKYRWDATQRAARELDAELSSPISAALVEAIDALTERPFSQRIRDHEKAMEKSK